MGPETNLFTIALGLQAPWSVSDVRFDTKAKEIHFEIRFKARHPVCLPVLWRGRSAGP